MDSKLKELYECLMACTGQGRLKSMVDGALILNSTDIKKDELDSLLKKLGDDNVIRCSKLYKQHNLTFGHIYTYSVEIINKGYKPPKTDEKRKQMEQLAVDAINRQLKPTNLINLYENAADSEVSKSESGGILAKLLRNIKIIPGKK